MQRRVLFQMVLAILLVASIAGCTDAPTDGTGAPGGGDADGADDAGPEGPLAGIDPGIITLPLPTGAPGGAEGVVYDLQNGTPLGAATVVVTCLRQALPGAEASEAQRLPVAGDGSFAVPKTSAFTDCVTVTYTVEAAGYTLQVPLESGPLVPGVQYLIHAGMTPQP